MTKYIVILTRDVREEAQACVDAESEDEASDMAVEKAEELDFVPIHKSMYTVEAVIEVDGIGENRCTTTK